MWRCLLQLRLTPPGFLQAKEEMFTGQAFVSSWGRVAGQKQVSKGQFDHEGARWILVGRGAQQQDYCMSASLTCYINRCLYSIKETVLSS